MTKWLYLSGNSVGKIAHVSKLCIIPLVKSSIGLKLVYLEVLDIN